jgi:hypothetical protein
LRKLRLIATNGLAFGATGAGAEVIGNLVPRYGADPGAETLAVRLAAKIANAASYLNAHLLRQVFRILSRNAGLLGRLADVPCDHAA